MKNHVIYTAVSGIDESYIADTENMPEIKAEFRRERKRKSAALIGICACVCFVIAAGWISSQNRFGRTPSVIPNETTNAGSHLTAPPQTEPTETQPGSIPPATDSTQSFEERQPTTVGEQPAVSDQETEPAAPIPETTDGREVEPDTTTNPPTVPEDEVVFYQMYTYVIVSSTFSDYRLGKSVGDEMVGQRLEDAAATGVYIQTDGTILEDETLRCEIFALKGVDPGIAVCVRFTDRGKGLKTDRWYLLYHPDADISAIEAY